MIDYFLDISEEWSVNFLFLIFVVFAFLLVISLIRRYTTFDDPEKGIHIDPIELKTGDILGVGYSNVAGMFTSSFSRSVWSHTGIVWVDPDTNIRYILEGAMYPEKKYQGFMRIPFDNWYFYNSCFICGICRYQGPPLDPHKVIKEFSKFEGKVKLEGFNPSWGRFLVNKPYFPSQINDYYTCYEVTILMLQNLGIYQKILLHSSYFPKHIMNGYIPCENGFSFAPIERFYLVPTLNRLIKFEKYKNRKNR